VKRIWLRRLAWAAAVVVGLLVVVTLAVVLSLDSILTRTVRVSLERALGVGVRLDRVELGLRDGSYRIHNLVLSNPPGFGPGHMLSLPELYVRADLAAATSNLFRLSEVRVHLEELRIVRDQKGRTNVPGLDGQGPEKMTQNLLRGMEFGGIDRLQLTLGRVAMIDESDPRRSVQWDLAVTNYALTNVTHWGAFLPLAIELALRNQRPLPISLPGTTTVPSEVPLR
jgi:hypothetical protein